MGKKVGIICFLGLVQACGGSGAGEEPEVVTCAITAPGAGDVLVDTVDVVVELTGPVARVEILVGGEVAGAADVAEGGTSATVAWDTGGVDDGSVEIAARATGVAGTVEDSGSVTVVVDNTAPVAGFGMERPGVLQGEAELGLVIEEANVASVRILEGESEIFSSEGMVERGTWDTTAVEDGLYYLDLEVVDAAGRTAGVTGFPVIVANSGEERAVSYDPAAQVYIPENWAEVEYHVRGYATSMPEVRQVISWLVWDPTDVWAIEYAIGQGLCPHRGIEYLSGESESGEIIVSLKREELAPWIVPRLPVEDQTSDVFPYNTDPLTFGSFFGHVATLNPSEHVGGTLPIEIGMVFLY